MDIDTSLLMQLGATQSNAERYAADLAAAAEEFEINTDEQVAMWLANLAHESAHFSTLTENLNYSAEGLCRVWPSRFSMGGVSGRRDANQYHRQPEKIANAVYALRYGNGDEASGDGWKYRGRGFIQLTFRDNYRQFGEMLGVGLEDDPSLALDPATACRVAGAFWQVKGCAALADAGNVEAVRRKINGGTIGLAEVEKLYRRVTGD